MRALPKGTIADSCLLPVPKSGIENVVLRSYLSQTIGHLAYNFSNGQVQQTTLDNSPFFEHYGTLVLI